MYHSFLIHSSAHGYLGCFHVLAIVSSAAMNIGMHVTLSVLISSVCMPSSGIAGSYGNLISSLSGNLHTVLYSGCTSLHPYQQCKRVSLSPHHLQHLLFVDFLIAAILNRHEMVPHCGFDLHFSDNNWCWASFMCLLAICMSSLEKCLFSSLAHFFIGSCFFWSWAGGAAYIFLRLILCLLLRLLLFSPNLRAVFSPCL